MNWNLTFDPLSIILITAIGALLLVICVAVVIRDRKRRSTLTPEQLAQERADEQFRDGW